MRSLLTLGTLLVLLTAPVFVRGDEHPPQGLTVGFSQAEITPPAGTKLTGPTGGRVVGTDDPLYVRTLVVQRGSRTLAIVSLDLVKIRLDLANAAIADASKRTGIGRNAVLICPTHNHSSPWIPQGGPHNKDYIATLPKRIADSIERAYDARQPARMFLGRSLVYDGLHNRRVILKADGLALNTWLKKLNDLEQTPQVLGTAGPIDPELWVARFDSLDGKVLGTLVNFACHPHIHNRRRLRWSADYPGLIADQLAEEYGKQVVSVFTQGCSGNINPNWAMDPKWKEKAAVFAAAAVDAARRATPIAAPVIVDYARRDVVVPNRGAEQRAGAISRLGWRPEKFEAARKSAARLPKTRKVPVSAARIGPLGIATNAGELFVEWGIDIKRRSPFPHTIVCELTNDWIGYEPTAQGFQHEGYETLVGVNFVPLEGIERLVDTSVDLLKQLQRKDERPLEGNPRD